MKIQKDPPNLPKAFLGSNPPPVDNVMQFNSDPDALAADDWLIRHSSSAYRIFRFLVHNMNEYNESLCHYEEIQEKFGFSRAAVSKGIKLLKDHKYIKVEKFGTNNIYLINKELYCFSIEGYNNAKFGAKVILDTSE